jgi:hypothetical protein
MSEPVTPVPTPPHYTEGWAKQDPVSKSVAVRTNFPDPYYDHQWGVMTVDRGGHYSSYDEIENWEDLTAGATREEVQSDDE